MENLTVFTTIDHNYADSSLISLHSFRKYHEHSVKVYCLDFTDKEFSRYKSNTSKIGNITPIDWKMKRVDDSLCDWNEFYSDIFQQISAKFDVLNDIHTEWIWYFDTDTIFLNSMNGMLKEPNELNGVCLNKTQSDINCGLFLIKNRPIDWLKEYLEFCKIHKFDHLSLDEGFLGELYSGKIKLLPKEYNLNGYYPVTESTKMVHYMGGIKPFCITKDYNPICIDFTTHFNLWYDYYDSVKSQFTLSDEFVRKVDRIRNTKFDVYDIANSHYATRMFLSIGEAGVKLVMNKMISDYKKDK